MGDHSTDRIDLSYLSMDQRNRFVMLMRAESIGYRFHHELVFFPHARRPDVEAVLEEVRQLGDRLQGDASLVMSGSPEIAAPGSQDWLDDGHEPEDGPAIAGAERRLGAYMIDSIVGGGIWMLLAILAQGTESVWGLVGAFALSAFVMVVRPIARTGRTVGALYLGIRVVRIQDDQPPGWIASVIRWLVTAIPSLVLLGVRAIGIPGGAEYWLSWFAFAGWVWIYAAMLFGPWEQGLHDRAAETIVIVDPIPSDHFLRRAARQPMVGAWGEQLTEE